MKITIDKDFTTLAQLPKVKEDIKEFKARYSDCDVYGTFCDVVENLPVWGCDILSVTGKAFPGGYSYGDETQFSIEIIGRRFDEFIVIRFYCDLELKIDTGDLLDYRGISTGRKMYSVEVYSRA